ncbi:MAG TPA: cytochrome c-type biogenesis protein [Ensifer sp.]|nr:cytochrome c-type biogenesis protein [Ensifer sp.]
MIRRLAFALFLLLSALPAHAVNPDEVLADPKLEARAREISSHLRCLVCQNQSIDDSNAELARDLRLLVRERLKSGATDQQVYDYLVSRYGEFVLLKPRLSEHTLLLWGAPAVLAIIGVMSIAFFATSRNRKRKAVALSDEEKARLEAILKE